MSMGIGIALLVVGAILSFAVKDSVPGVNLAMIGYICMGGGAIALVMAIVSNAQSTHTRNTSVVEHREPEA